MPQDLLRELGIADSPRLAPPSTEEHQGIIQSLNPTTGEPIAGVRMDNADAYEIAAAGAKSAFLRWRQVPAPERGQVVRAIGEELRKNLEPLGKLVSLEVGKVQAEGIGEVQETIDIADFAVGLSRQLHGITMPSERPEHRMFEQWLPMGPVGVITAFNFPNAVWGWNAMLAAVCGDSVLWKPSLLAPLTAIATNAIANRVAEKLGHPGVFGLVIGQDDVVGEKLIADKRFPLISATGSTKMGRHVNQVVAGRLGKCLLELGGNNALIVESDANLDLALKSVVFGSVGTSGQRCTTTRRLLVNTDIADEFTEKVVQAFKSVKIGDPLQSGVLCGPVIGERTAEAYDRAIKLAKEQGGEVLCGGSRVSPDNTTPPGLGGVFLEPTVIRVPHGADLEIAKEETFAPILYVFSYKDLDEALTMQNSVDQGLSSAIFTGSVRSSERFLNPSGAGSDCGLAYVNLGTSGAEIGGAFGGEKDTGGGRESGSDAWKAYMRRQTCTIGFATEMRLAQGIQLDL